MSALAAIPRAPYQLMPDLTPTEYAWLRGDIEDRGVLVPVEVDENGTILDGHNRARIADELGIEYPTVVRSGMTEAEKRRHVYSLNVVRRQLSGHDRNAVIARMRSEGFSLRDIARVVGVNASTVSRSLRGVADATPDSDSAEERDEDGLMPDTPLDRARTDEEIVRGSGEPDPLPALQTQAEKAAELREAGMSQRAIAAELGIAQSKVSNLLSKGHDRYVVDTPVEWPSTKSLIAELRSFASTDPRRIAASVPNRNRATTARQLRQVGTFLGSIALELERSER